MYSGDESQEFSRKKTVNQCVFLVSEGYDFDAKKQKNTTEQREKALEKRCLTDARKHNICAVNQAKIEADFSGKRGIFCEFIFDFGAE